ncbi:hypothetical protein AVEN_250888-1 [Araneus ventricosus]|uniref:Uncharacterized protein n=1 Tax=Araneus ventricosus TaxID=182803 RepID=A0A4Y2NL34_ARAVE|nr:hypothetical protein AVEN_250888-1 [Araneus ventricosus]
MHSCRIISKFFTSPHDSKGFLFNLCITTFRWGQSPRCIAITDLLPSACFWQIVAQKPYDEASVVTVVPLLGSNIHWIKDSQDLTKVFSSISAELILALLPT